MAILTFEQRHDLGKASLFCPSKFNNNNNNKLIYLHISTRCTRGVRVVFSRARMRSS